MSTKVRDGLEKIRSIKYTHSAITTVNTIYLLAGLIMLAANTAAANIANIFVIAGLIEYAKATGAWTAGQKIYWDNTNSVFTTVPAGNTLAGIAPEDVASAATTGFVILMPEMKAASGPSHSIKFAGTSTAEDDADAEVVVTVTGALATDVAVVTLRAATNAVYVTKAILTADTLTVTLSGNGGVGTQVDYMICRAVI